MNCKQCASGNPKTFNGEVAIHFPGIDGLDKPIVWVFPKMLVCSKCGFAEFTVPERELSVLVLGKAVPGAVVLSNDIQTENGAGKKLVRTATSQSPTKKVFALKHGS